MSMWVYNGADIVSNGLRANGMWEAHETQEIMSKLSKNCSSRITVQRFELLHQLGFTGCV
jgi:hypothetical protein